MNKDTNANIIMRDRIKLLQDEVQDLMKQLNVSEYIPNTRKDGIKRMSSGFTLDQILVNKIRNAVRANHLRVIADIEEPLWNFIREIEKKVGTIDPTRSRDRLPLDKPREKYTTAQLVIRQINKQISKLKQEYGEK